MKMRKWHDDNQDEDDEGEAIFTHHLYVVAFCSSIAHSWMWL
jgi:hypothetical protein